MINTYHALHKKATYTLARSIVFKSLATHEKLNRRMEYLNYPTELVEEKDMLYYRSLNGQYMNDLFNMQLPIIPEDSNSNSGMRRSDIENMSPMGDFTLPMFVKSLDIENETILFNKENLSVHVATKETYLEKGQFYDDLVKKYPKQQLLIDGILNPIPPEVSVSADDHTILSFDDNLVEPQEITLMHRLQAWYTATMETWFVRGYVLMDDLYVSAREGMVAAQIPGKIMSLRFHNCRTHEVHSFHIRCYLESKYRLDASIPYLSHDKQLYLYRNLTYLENNAGKQKTFDELVKVFLTQQNIPLSTYELYQDLENLVTDLKPTTRTFRVDVNGVGGEQGLDDRNVESLLLLEDASAYNNPQERRLALKDIESKTAYADTSQLPTKVFESSILDSSNSVIYPKVSTYIDHWLMYTFTGRFTRSITVNNARTGFPFTVGGKDLGILYLFTLQMMAGGISQPAIYADGNRVNQFTNSSGDVYIPHRLTSIKTKRDVFPNITDLRKQVGWEHFDYSWLDAWHTGMTHPPTRFLSTSSMRVTIGEEWKLLNEGHDGAITAPFNDEIMDRQHIIDSYYERRAYDVVTSSTTYSEWLSNSNLELEGLTDAEYRILNANILEEIFAGEIKTISDLSFIQSESLKVISKLSSYGIQLIPTINLTSLSVHGFKTVKNNGVNTTTIHRDQHNLGRMVHHEQTTINKHERYDGTLRVSARFLDRDGVNNVVMDAPMNNLQFESETNARVVNLNRRNQLRMAATIASSPLTAELPITLLTEFNP